ncbi:MFS general substrate transporter [Aulographum hederae CBS 113979]|uniref:MFS general substrate transporter n=1 Tax=Aulographum hederae CBS 113979 TaxID=1176131 RepID=A0A6G1GYR9_9PEZI|nr:MFS general substrate transporter [Aulographum hederae CBS 113979]
MADDTPPRSPEPKGSPLSLSPPPKKSASHPKLVSFRQDSERLSLNLNEQSPLLRPREAVDDDPTFKSISPLSEDSWDAQGTEETRSSWYLFILTLGGLGLQIGWSVETSNGSPYLLSLGLSKSVLALVWIAGPLSGALVQPFVGIKSDNSRSKWGKRRPFIVGGTIATIMSLMLLAWAREIVSGILGLFGADKESNGVRICVMVFAVTWVYILDFAINVIQAGIRAFVVDCAPTHQQDSANAWISRTASAGNILGYLAGFVNLPKIFPFFGYSQFKVLCAIASIALFVTIGISCGFIKERDPRKDADPVEMDSGVINFFRGLARSVRRLPPQISRVCQVQFVAWIGWFPFLFYITVYVGEIYVQPYYIAKPHMSQNEMDDLWERATRVGTFALLIFALTTFGASILLPFFIAPTYQPTAPTAATPMTPTTPGSLAGSGYFDFRHSRSRLNLSLHRTKWERFWAFLNHLQIKWLTLRRAWLISHLIFACCMAATFFVRDVTGATILVGVIGIPWALTSWAPFALISAEISKRDAIRRGMIRPPPTQDGELLASGEDDSADQAGVVLGIHNVAVSLPQVIATVICSVIFKFLQHPRGVPGDESVTWTLRFAGICAIGAAFMTTRVGEEMEGVESEDEWEDPIRSPPLTR